MKLSALGEDRLIRRIARGVRLDASVLRGIGDDCAVLKGAGGKLLLFASDMLVEGVHFLPSARPEAIGWKALAVNVSDVAAMGGLPRWAVISLGLPRNQSVSFVDRLYRGLRRCAARFGVNLVGGDTVRAPRVTVDVAIVGEVGRDRLTLRSGARPGDALLVTGRLGGAVRSGRHLAFTPRLKEARALGARAKLHAMMDLSDGLACDLPRLCEQSGVGAALEIGRLPRRRGLSAARALSEGEDFELLIAAAPAQARRLLRWAEKNLPCGLTRIGWVVPYRGGKRVTLISPAGAPLRRIPAGFRHF